MRSAATHCTHCSGEQCQSSVRAGTISHSRWIYHTNVEDAVELIYHECCSTTLATLLPFAKS